MFWKRKSKQNQWGVDGAKRMKHKVKKTADENKNGIREKQVGQELKNWSNEKEISAVNK